MYNNLYNYEYPYDRPLYMQTDTLYGNGYNLYDGRRNKCIHRYLEKQEEFMTFRLGICDDTQLDIACLTEHIKHYMISYNIQFEIESFQSGEALLQAQRKHPFQILLLDIEMPGINGMTIARYLRDELYDESFIVFVTSYPEYMQESFEVQPFQFLTKPVSYVRIEKLLSDIIHRYQHSHVTKIVIDTNGEEHLIPVNNLLYIQAVKGEKRYLEYHLTDAILYGEGTIQEWENRLATHSFYSTYRGYLINIGHIQIIQQTHVLMDNGEQLPISRRKISPLQQLYADRIIHVLN